MNYPESTSLRRIRPLHSEALKLAICELRYPANIMLDRSRKAAPCRHAVWRRMGDYGFTSLEIGYLCGFDHTAVLHGLGNTGAPPHPHDTAELANAIAAGASREAGVPVESLYQRGRHRNVVTAREIIAVLLRERVELSLPRIAEAMMRPNHSSVVDMLNRVRGRGAEWRERVDRAWVYAMGGVRVRAEPISQTPPPVEPSPMRFHLVTRDGYACSVPIGKLKRRAAS